MSRGASRVVIVELDEGGGAAAIERIRRACDAERSARVVAVSRDPALALPAMLAGAADFALVPRDSTWLAGVRAAEADRRERALRAPAPEGRLLIDVPPDGLPYEEYERRIVDHALCRAGWNRSRAARELGISRPRLLRKIARFGLHDPRMRGEFREIDHAADLGLDLRGPDPGAVLEAAQRGLVQVLFGEAPAVDATEERQVRIEETDHPELLKAWCERLYRLLERESFLAVDSRIESADPADFRARLSGAILTPATRVAASELKAVTWHQLAFEPDPEGGWKARVIFDV